MDSVRALDCLSAWVTHNPLFQGLKVHVDEYSDGSQIDDVMQLMLAALNHAPQNRDVKVVLGKFVYMYIQLSHAR
jgi:peroxin-5